MNKTTKPISVVLINAYSAGNAGDAAICKAQGRLVRELYPNAQISIMSSYVNENSIEYASEEIKSISAAWVLDPRTNYLVRYLQGLWLFSRALVNPAKVAGGPLASADFVVSVGGGYLYSSKKGALGFGLIWSLFHIWLSKRLGKPVLCGPITLGPLRYELDKRLTNSVLARANTILLRDRESLELVEKFQNNGVFCPDAAFFFALDDSVSELQPDMKLGITVLDWGFASAKANREAADMYVNKVCSLVKQLRVKYPHLAVEIFIQVDVTTGKDSDSDISMRLFEAIGENCLITNVSKYAPEKLVQTYNRCSIFLASRMHSAIFAMDAGVPTVALAYQPKTFGLFAFLGLEQRALDIFDFTPEQVSDTFTSILDHLDDERASIRSLAGSAKRQLRTLWRERCCLV